MKELFSGGDKTEDLLSWSDNLRELGDFIAIISVESDIDSSYYEKIGRIISDYAGAIHDRIDVAYHALSEFYAQGGDLPISWLEREYKRLANFQKNGAWDAVTDTEQLKKVVTEVEESVEDLAGFVKLHSKLSELGEKLSSSKEPDTSLASATADAEEPAADNGAVGFGPDKVDGIIDYAEKALDSVEKQGGFFSPEDYADTIKDLSHTVDKYRELYENSNRILKGFLEFKEKSLHAGDGHRNDNGMKD